MSVSNGEPPDVGADDHRRVESHLLVLATMMEVLETQQGISKRMSPEIEKLISAKGSRRLQDSLLESVQPKVKEILRTRRLEFETLSQACEEDPKATSLPGVYVHLVGDPNDKKYRGVYVGSSVNLSRRISEHLKTHASIEAGHRRPSKYPGETKRAHQQFWSRRRGLRSGWLLFAIVRQNHMTGLRDSLNALLSLLELYAALLFRTLPVNELSNYLSPDLDDEPPAWAALNSASPLEQLRTPIHFASYRPRRFASSLPFIYRHAIPLLGDRKQVAVVCPHCRSRISRRIDNHPRYEKSTGKYLNRMRAKCQVCLTGKVVAHVPEDQSLPSRNFDSLRQEASLQEAYHEIAQPIPRDKLKNLSRQGLRAWLCSKGFDMHLAVHGRKANILTRAEAVWDFLCTDGSDEARSVLYNVLENNRAWYPGDKMPPSQKLSSKVVMVRPKIVTIQTTEVKPPPPEFFDSIDLETFPRCQQCFSQHVLCDGRKPCGRCQDENRPCEQVTMECLQSLPSLAWYVVHGARGPTPKVSESLTINTASFPRCSFCLLRRYKCSGARPCERCSKSPALCRDVSEDELRAHPDRARHMLKLDSRGQACDTPCRVCVYAGRQCYRESPLVPCVSCVDLGRRCTNDLSGIKRKGMHAKHDD